MDKYFLVRDVTATPNDWVPSTYATLRVNPKAKDKIEQMMQVCKENNLLKLSYFDFDCTAYFIDDENPPNIDPDHYEFFDNLLQEKTFVEIDKKLFDEVSGFALRTDAETTVVYKDRFLIQSYLEHGVTQFETPDFSLEIFKSWM